uniref:Cathepsin propeptide inhibitor domain-containing protein n=1 Tax=Megaselia scalaris TaxID=36166 RepID=T1GJC5_MEGSC
MQSSIIILFFGLINFILADYESSPKDLESSPKDDLAYNLKTFIEKCKDFNKCVINEEKEYGPENISFEQKDLFFKLNITKFKISGKNEFNVAKSHYDKDTRRYELH